MRRWLALAVALLVAGAVVEVAAQTGSRAIATRIYTCGTTITTLVSANPNRLNLTLINVGTIHVGLSGQMHSASTLAADGFFSLHVGSAIEFNNFTGGLSCTAAGPVEIHVMDEYR